MLYELPARTWLAVENLVYNLTESRMMAAPSSRSELREFFRRKANLSSSATAKHHPYHILS